LIVSNKSKLKGAVHKRRSQSRESLSNAYKEGGGSSAADIRTYWCKKISNFLKFVVYLHGKRGRGVWASADILRTREINFSRFYADNFYDGPKIFRV